MSDLKRSFEDRLCEVLEDLGRDYPVGPRSYASQVLCFHPDGELEVKLGPRGTPWHSMPEPSVYRAVAATCIVGQHKERCPLRTDLRDWLHRLDARGEMRGQELGDAFAMGRDGTAPFGEAYDFAMKHLAHLERGGWIVRQRRGGSSCWVPGPKFDLAWLERWYEAGGGQDGSGMLPLPPPLPTSVKPMEQLSFALEEAS